MPPHVFGAHAPHPDSRVHRAITLPPMPAANSNEPPAPPASTAPRDTAIERIAMAAIVGISAAFWIALLWLAVDKAVNLAADPPPVACMQPRGQA
jgi:hypothetical protein